MIVNLDNVIFVSGSERSFTNRETGEIRTYKKALFAQDGSDPLELTVDDDVFPSLVSMGMYNLDLSINSYSKGFSVKVTGCAAV